MVGASTVKWPVALLAPSLALTAAFTFAATGTVETEKVAEVDPGCTITASGMVITALVVDSKTVAPRPVAFLDKDTVPVALAPPATAVGENVTLVTVCAPAIAAATAPSKQMVVRADMNPRENLSRE
jgi:hypothetical protein